MFRILVLCTGNSCRSQMAQSILERLLPSEQFEILSAGTQKHGMNPFALKLLKADGAETEHLFSKTIEEIPQPDAVDLLFSVCDSAQNSCPHFPAKKRVHKSFEDPPKLSMHLSDDEAYKVYLSVYKEIEAFCKTLAAELLAAQA